MLDEDGRVKPIGSLALVFDHALPKDDETAYGDYVADQLDLVSRRNELIQRST